jgi:hypothetical protein
MRPPKSMGYLPTCDNEFASANRLRRMTCFTAILSQRYLKKSFLTWDDFLHKIRLPDGEIVAFMTIYPNSNPQVSSSRFYRFISNG